MSFPSFRRSRQRPQGELLELEEEFIRCTRCGSCQAVCPVFQELQLESAVARGRVQMIKAAAWGQLDLTRTFAHRMSLCIMCETCSENCPSGVRVERVVQGARSRLLRRRRMPSIKRIMYNVFFADRGALNFAIGFALRVQRLFFRVNRTRDEMKPRITIGLSRRRILKTISPRSFRELCPEIVPTRGPRLKVAFFTGCMINYLYPEVGTSIVRVLSEAGVEVMIPASQQCCGTPMRVAGEEVSALKVVRRNLETFCELDVDYVVTGCASCGNALKRHFVELTRRDARLYEMALSLAAKTKDFTELCVSLDVLKQLPRADVPVRPRITYHDPCHLARGQGIRTEPRTILRELVGTNYVEMDGADRCCGSGGVFGFDHYELSMQIAARKVNSIRSTEAQVCVTSCPACQMHLNDALRRCGTAVEVLHIAQLVDEALLGPKGSRNRMVCERSLPIDKTAIGSPNSSSIRFR